MRDILNLNNSLAPRLIRCLYTVALVLITVMVLLGLLRGIRIMTQPHALQAGIVVGSQNPAPTAGTNDAAPAPPPSAAQIQRRMDDRRMMMRERYREFRGRRRFGMFGLGRNPLLGGLFVIFGALLRGAIVLMIVRILAEVGLAVLAMPRRGET